MPLPFRVNTAVALVASIALFASAGADAQTTLRIGMTAADIPATTSQPDSGFEGNRFTGLTLFDALTMWDLTSAEKASTIVPGLAESWAVDAKDKTKWVFKLRKGAKFHDGTDFNADAAIFNFDKVLDKTKPQYDARLVAQTTPRMPTVTGARKIDDYTVEVQTSEPDSFVPINLSNLFIASPAAWAKTKSWAEFAKAPVGSGPWKFVRLVPRERLELEKYAGYWDAKRVPKTDRLVLIPMPDSSTRVNALLSGQVDWIEAAPGDAIAQLKSRGMQITSNPYPHTWPWQLSFVAEHPTANLKVRQAMNLAIDRDAIVSLLGGFAAPAKGAVPPGHPWWGDPKFEIKYDLKTAQKLMSDAGFSATKRLKVKTITSASGSGQMQPVSMNEFVQQALKACFFEVELDVVEWNALFTNWRAGAKDPTSRGANATNVTFAAMDPFFAMVRFTSTKTFPPVSNNWGYFGNAEFDDLIMKARTSFEDKARDAALARLHARIVEEAPFLWVAHDVGPRAMSPKVKGVVQPKSWFIDIATMSM